MRRFVAFLWFLAVAQGVGLPAADVVRYGRFEQSFTSTRDYADPLTDVEVIVEFRGPGGRRERAPAFWDGGRQWKVRFSPPQTGRWTYSVACSDSANHGLAGQSGGFRVKPYQGSNELYRHGGPALSWNRRYFVHSGDGASRLRGLRPSQEGMPDWKVVGGQGKPWFWLGDTAWNGALLSTRDEWEKYLADRAAKKFSVIQLVMTQWRAGRADELGQVAFTGVERIRVNPAFFQRMDERLDAVNDHGLVAAPVLLWALSSKDKESPGVVLPPGQAALLARYMVARCGAHHVVWVLGGDGDYRAAQAERWKTIGRAVFPADFTRRPVTMHPRGMQSPWAEYKNEPWLDVLMFQSGHGNDARKWRWNATQGAAADWKLEPPRPVIDGEINYEGHLSYQDGKPIGEAQVRRAAYYSLLAAPPAGVTYGAHGIWAWARTPEAPLDHPRSGVALPWQECLNYPGAQQMRVLREVFESIPWWKLRPDRALLAEDPQDPEFRSYIMPARSESGDFALLYLPGNPAVKLNLARWRKPVSAAWIDPRTGRRTLAGKLQPAPSMELQTPGPGDWLLLLR
jgi:hypothetical protein